MISCNSNRYKRLYFFPLFSLGYIFDKLKGFAIKVGVVDLRHIASFELCEDTIPFMNLNHFIDA